MLLSWNMFDKICFNLYIMLCFYCCIFFLTNFFIWILCCYVFIVVLIFVDNNIKEKHLKDIYIYLEKLYVTCPLKKGIIITIDSNYYCVIFSLKKGIIITISPNYYSVIFSLRFSSQFSRFDLFPFFAAYNLSIFWVEGIECTS